MTRIKQSRLKELLKYNPMTGVFVWISSNTNSITKGSKAGTKSADGYISIQIDGFIYRAHRLAFLYMTGEIPEQVDHIDHDRENNKWSNLRPATNLVNKRNMSLRKSNISGCNGVCWSESRKRWEVKIGLHGKTVHLGRFKDLDAAIAARKAAELKHGFHENHGK